MDNNMTQHPLLLPLFVQLLLVLLVWLNLYRTRIGYMKKHRIHPQKVASRSQATEMLKEVSSGADNFANQFELPVIFYVACLLSMQFNVEGMLITITAWLFVAGRYVHSLIHLTNNKVMHRFLIYVASGWMLWIMVALIGFELFTGK